VAVLLELDEPENEELVARLQTVGFRCRNRGLRRPGLSIQS